MPDSVQAQAGVSTMDSTITLLGLLPIGASRGPWEQVWILQQDDQDHARS